MTGAEDAGAGAGVTTGGFPIGAAGGAAAAGLATEAVEAGAVAAGAGLAAAGGLAAGGGDCTATGVAVLAAAGADFDPKSERHHDVFGWSCAGTCGAAEAVAAEGGA